MEEKESEVQKNDDDNGEQGDEIEDEEEEEDIEKRKQRLLMKQKMRKIKEEESEINAENIIKERPGPKMKRSKINKKEDKELQMACEDPEERKERIREEKREKKIAKLKKKEEDLKNNNLIFIIDEENYKCVDCGKEKTTHISINNGVTLCSSCSLEHISLGHSISYLKNIDDQLDEYLFNFIVFGSNSKFKKFLLSEKMNRNLPIKNKYKTKGLYFYRKMLKNKIKGLPDPIKDYNDPNEIFENNNNDDFPELNRYKITKQIIINGTLKGESKLKKIINKIMNIGGNNKNDNKVMIRTISSLSELKNENLNGGEAEVNEILNLHNKSQARKPQRSNDNNLFKETSRPLKDEKNETEKTDGNEDIPSCQQQTSEVIIENEKI